MVFKLLQMRFVQLSFCHSSLFELLALKSRGDLCHKALHRPTRLKSVKPSRANRPATSVRCSCSHRYWSCPRTSAALPIRTRLRSTRSSKLSLLIIVRAAHVTTIGLGVFPVGCQAMRTGRGTAILFNPIGSRGPGFFTILPNIDMVNPKIRGVKSGRLFHEQRGRPQP